MTKYEQLMNKSDECCLKAIEFAKKGDNAMATFLRMLRQASKKKARNLPMSIATLSVEGDK